MSIAWLNKSGLKGTGTVCHTVVNFWGPIRHQTSSSPSMNHPWWAHFSVSHLTKDPGDLQQWQNSPEYYQYFPSPQSLHSPRCQLSVENWFRYFQRLVCLLSEAVKGNPYGSRWREPSFTHFCIWFGKPKNTDRSQEKEMCVPQSKPSAWKCHCREWKLTDRN